MKLKLLVLSAALLFSHTVSAECVMRSATVNQSRATVQRIDNFQRVLMPEGADKMRCVVTFRAMIKNQWFDARGDSIGPMNGSLDQICAQAEQFGRANILQTVAGQSSVMTDMICTDQAPKTQVFVPVAMGQVISLSEVAPDPAHPKSFTYKNSMECRWFLETVPLQGGGFSQNKGIACRIRNDSWYVADKWIQLVDR